jgi:acyl-CoA synthetase (AMP-forming)/AMP-acid ligase II
MRGYVNAPHSVAFLIDSAREQGELTAIVDGERRWSFARLSACADAIASGLISRHSLVPGDRVALAARNSPEWMAAFLGIMAAGGIVVPLNGWWTGEEMGFALTESRPRLVLAGSRRRSVCKLMPARSARR